MKINSYMPVRRNAISLPRDPAVQTVVPWLRRAVAGLSSRGGFETHVSKCGICGGQSGIGTGV